MKTSDECRGAQSHVMLLWSAKKQGTCKTGGGMGERLNPLRSTIRRGGKYWKEESKDSEGATKKTKCQTNFDADRVGKERDPKETFCSF